jgi:hypothetical protein
MEDNSMKVEYRRRSDGMVNKWKQVMASAIDNDLYEEIMESGNKFLDRPVWVVEDVLTENEYRFGIRKKKKR